MYVRTASLLQNVNTSLIGAVFQEAGSECGGEMFSDVDACSRESSFGRSSPSPTSKGPTPNSHEESEREGTLIVSRHGVL